jgi:hypothetical protein
MMNKPKTQSRTGSADTAAARIGGFTGGHRFTYSKPSTTDWSKPAWSRYGKASDEEMYWDDEDEMAIPPDTDDKALTDVQAAGLRAAGDYFGDKDKGKERIAGFNRTLASGYAGLTHNPQKPNTSVGGGRGLNPGNSGPNKRPNTGMSNKPNRPVAPGRTGSADSIERRNPPVKPASSGNKDTWYRVMNWNN